MKKISTLFALTLGLSASAQISTIPDENIDPADSLEIIFDPSALDLAVGHQDLLKQAMWMQVKTCTFGRGSRQNTRTVIRM